MTDGEDQELERARAELERLQAENERLKTHPDGSGHSGWVRGTAAIVLFVLGTLLVPVAGIAVWSRNTILDTDRYVETVAPLSDEPQVIDSVATRITDAIFARVDVESELQKYLPPRLVFAAGPIASQVKSTTRELVVKALETDQFDTLWREVNRTASTALVAYVKGDGPSTLTIDHGQLFLELGPIVDSVSQTLSQQGFSLADKIPSTSATVQMPIGDVSALEKLKSTLRLLNVLAYVLPFLAIACFAGAVLLTRNRRRGVVWAGVLLSASVLVVGIGLALGREVYLDAASNGGANPETAAVLFDTLVRFLRNGIRVIFLIGVVIAIGALITGPSPWAVRTRTTLGGLVTSGGERTGWDSGAFGEFFARHRLGLMATATVVMAAWLFLMGQPTPASVLWLALGLLVLIALIQFVAATAPREPAGSEGETQEIQI